MSDPTIPPEVVFDLLSAPADQREQLDQVAESLVGTEQTLLISHSNSSFRLGIGMGASISIRVSGDIGDYGWFGNGGAVVEIEGDAGRNCGTAQEAGSIVVHGNASESLGSYCRGGWVAVYGNAEDRCGAGMVGGEVIVRGNAGNEAGLGMRGGTLIIGGSAGANLGRGFEGGLILVRGEVDSIAPEIEEFRLKESDRFKLGLLMLKAGIKASGKEFRGYRRIPT